ncbi:MAG: hypothetical protein JWR63_4411 [Conexibacter sp.]|nr:hypothetical protein [Conexibacter sp.]
MPLDPIVSLSVALAEAPEACAFFLGSGVSRDAGVPTGWEVLRAGLHRLRQVELADGSQVSDEELDRWLAENGHEDMSYSELLAAIAPDMAVRREYLAGLFEGVKPGPTHEALADLAAEGVVKVFVTTNFDRLLEHALQRRGIEPVVIASDADLDVAVPREHAACIVLKPHGDYLRQTIRNTPEELAQLDPAMSAELAQVFDRYGIVVLGYSGSDEGISTLLRARRSRYGLWWVARGEPQQQAAELVAATGGRVIRRESAAAFLTDLRARLAVFAAHPTGQTPAVVHDEVLGLLRRGDMVGLDELLRRESNEYERAFSAVVVDAQQRNANDAQQAREVWARMLPVLERRLAGLVVLALHDEQRFADQMLELARGLERQPLRAGYEAWNALPRFGATWLGYVVGALMMRLDRLGPVGLLARAAWTAPSYGTPLLVWLPGDAADVLANALAPAGSWVSPVWEFLTSSLGGPGWLLERYPELAVDREPRYSMAQFDLVLCLHHALIGHRSVAFFSLGGEAAVDLALRLHADAAVRGRVATALGVSLDDFDSRAPAGLEQARSWMESWVNPAGIAAILQEGRTAL